MSAIRRITATAITTTIAGLIGISGIAAADDDTPWGAADTHGVGGSTFAGFR